MPAKKHDVFLVILNVLCRQSRHNTLEALKMGKGAVEPSFKRWVDMDEGSGDRRRQRTGRQRTGGKETEENKRDMSLEDAIAAEGIKKRSCKTVKKSVSSTLLSHYRAGDDALNNSIIF